MYMRTTMNKINSFVCTNFMNFLNCMLLSFGSTKSKAKEKLQFQISVTEYEKTIYNSSEFEHVRGQKVIDVGLNYYLQFGI